MTVRLGASDAGTLWLRESGASRQVWPADPGPGGTTPTLRGAAVGGGWIGSPTTTWNIPTITGLESTDHVLVGALHEVGTVWSGTGWTVLDTIVSGGWELALLEGTGASTWTINASTSPSSCDIIAMAWDGSSNIVIGDAEGFYTGGDPGVYPIAGVSAGAPASAILVSFLEWTSGVTTLDPAGTRVPSGASGALAMHDRGGFPDGEVDSVDVDYPSAWTNAMGVQVVAIA